jgi:hypothetical protein
MEWSTGFYPLYCLEHNDLVNNVAVQVRIRIGPALS